MRGIFRVIGILAYLIVPATLSAFAQEPPKAAILFQQLRSPETTDQATEQLLKLGKSDARIKQYLGVHLPVLIERNPQDDPQVWKNAVRLAGELKITAAAPALAKWIGLNTGGSITFAGTERLENNAPGKALAQIGNPAVPALIGVLEHGRLSEREIAVRALKLMGTAPAMNALREHLKREPDPQLKDFIEKSLTS
jgi:hypothetical protein